MTGETLETLAGLDETYEVWDQFIGQLEAKVEKLNRRAGKLGIDGITVEFVEEPHQKNVKIGEHTEAHTKAVVRIVGEPPILNGWHFAGCVDHRDGMVTQYPHAPEAVNLKQYRGSEPTCDHCCYDRRRNETFVVYSEAEGTKRVGRQCVADFLGHTDPKRLLGVLGWWGMVADTFETMGGGYGGGVPIYGVETFLGWVAKAIRTRGWLSRKKAAEWEKHGAATADVAWTEMNWRPTQYDRTPPTKPTPEDEKMAGVTVAWVSGLTEKELESDYLFNLHTAISTGHFMAKRSGIVAAAVFSYQREMGLLEERAKKSNEHVGTVGKREIFEVKVVWMREFDGDYGTRTLIRFEDAVRNTITWWASNTRIVPDPTGGKRALEIGDELKIKATVKKHGLYREQKQTEIQRAAVVA